MKVYRDSYWKCNNPDGHCYCEGATSNVYPSILSFRHESGASGESAAPSEWDPEPKEVRINGDRICQWVVSPILINGIYWCYNIYNPLIRSPLIHPLAVRDIQVFSKKIRQIFSHLDHTMTGYTCFGVTLKDAPKSRPRSKFVDINRRSNRQVNPPSRIWRTGCFFLKRPQQGGPLPVISGVISPINGLING